MHEFMTTLGHESVGCFIIVEGEGVERGAVVRVSVKGEELVVW